MRFHWQNLNERRTARNQPQVYGWPHEGRCWLYVGESVTHFSWNLWSRFCIFEIGIDDENGLVLSVALPPVAFWFSFNWGRGFRRSRTFKISVHSWAIWWHVWKDWTDGWNSKDKWWQRREGSFHPIDFLFGRIICSEREIERRDILVPMPEKAYPATARLIENTRSRRRWLPKRSIGVSIDVPGGIPHQGKGENSYDCGVDGIYGLHCKARTIPEAVGTLVGSALNNRVRYGGWKDYEWKKSVGSK